ncbi:TetR/AcrR family transcriptional regulator [Pseudooctadecabacter jejudonensis]|uniref:Bacterial regulatory proteins, tetR family n=1 Tax=Pseudooctadecabacter jejudonensis TaxID=1391910 RepID=A0A1Y5RC62_9RHOB|nr:TetR/AcrR family transcriptional regulator [Pseudooctadecabacter jejudonensis]SLN13665.1 Bacterial regulatory proteins, tetR family [Pseudooctadecabacter jejudonensis]
MESARQIVTDAGFEALRTQDVVRRAQVAKGTFFSHFKDKDALMDVLIGERLNVLLDDMEAIPRFDTVDDLVAHSTPLLQFLSRDRFVFDVFLRMSGALAIEDIGDIATAIYRHHRILAGQLKDSPFRTDITTDLQAEGVQSFCINAVALSFCALHTDQDVQSRLMVYLNAWLCP